MQSASWSNDIPLVSRGVAAEAQRPQLYSVRDVSHQKISELEFPVFYSFLDLRVAKKSVHITQT